MISVALGAFFLAQQAQAASTGDNYFEIGYGQLSYKEAGFGNLSPSVIKGTLGTVVSEGFAIEGFVATGVSDDSIRYLGVPVTLSINHAFGVYARPFLKVGESAELFARAGFFRGKLTASANGYHFGTSGGDFSYGVGAAFNVSNNVQLTVDYMQYYDKENIKISGAGLGVKVAFGK